VADVLANVGGTQQRIGTAQWQQATGAAPARAVADVLANVGGTQQRIGTAQWQQATGDVTWSRAPEPGPGAG